MNNKTTVTTLNVSVGADNEQSPSVTKHSNSITDNNCVCLSVHQRLESRS